MILVIRIIYIGFVEWQGALAQPRYLYEVRVYPLPIPPTREYCGLAPQGRLAVQARALGAARARTAHARAHARARMLAPNEARG
jgi:hypothetical protein